MSDYEHPSDWRWDVEAYEPTASPMATVREMTEKDVQRATKKEKKVKQRTVGFGAVLDERPE